MPDGTPTPGFTPGRHEQLVAVVTGAKKVTWRWQASAPVREPIVVTDTGILAVTGWGGIHGGDSQVHLVDFEGQERWTFDSSRNVAMTVLGVTQRTAFLGTVGGTLSDAGEQLYGVSLDDGRVRWETEVGDVYGGTVVDRSLYVTEVGGLVAYSLDDGGMRWRYELDDPTATPRPSPEGSIVYLATNPVVAVSEQGVELWRKSVRQRVRGLATNGQRVFITDTGGTIQALDARTGTQEWSVSEDASESLTPPTVQNEVVYYGDVTGTVAAYTAADGRKRWHATTNSRIEDVAVSRDFVLARGRSTLTAFDRIDGTREWTFTIDEGLSPVTIADGDVYVGDRAGRLFQFCR